MQSEKSYKATGQTSNMSSDTYLPTGTRHFGAVNWLGLWTLYKREIQRFIKVGIQTILAPVVSSLLFLIIFKLALGQYRPDVNGIPFADFLAPGLIMMAILTNAFGNSSSSLLQAKLQGNLVDVLMPPLSAWELTLGFVLGAVTRGVVVAVVTGIGMIPFANMGVENWWAVIFFAFIASVIMAEIGVLTGIWAEKFDHMAVITNFVVTPLVFLSGTFYSVKRLPEVFFSISQWNPFFYLIDGFRYGFIGQSDSSVLLGAASMTALAVALGLVTYMAFQKGWKLKT